MEDFRKMEEAWAEMEKQEGLAGNDKQEDLAGNEKQEEAGATAKGNGNELGEYNALHILGDWEVLEPYYRPEASLPAVNFNVADWRAESTTEKDPFKILENAVDGLSVEARSLEVKLKLMILPEYHSLLDTAGPSTSGLQDKPFYKITPSAPPNTPESIGSSPSSPATPTEDGIPEEWSSDEY